MEEGIEMASKIDINAIRDNIEKRSLESWKVYNKNSGTDSITNNTSTSTTKSDSYSSSGNDMKKISLNTAKDIQAIDATGYNGSQSIQKELNTLKDLAQRSKDNKLTDDEKKNLVTLTQDSLKKINNLSDTTTNGIRPIKSLSAKELSISSIDLTSQDAVSRLNSAINKTKVSENKYATNMENDTKKIDSINAGNQQLTDVHSLIQNTRNQIMANPLNAMAAQGLLNSTNVSSLTSI